MVAVDFFGNLPPTLAKKFWTNFEILISLHRFVVATSDLLRRGVPWRSPGPRGVIVEEEGGEGGDFRSASPESLLACSLARSVHGVLLSTSPIFALLQLYNFYSTRKILRSFSQGKRKVLPSTKNWFKEKVISDVILLSSSRANRSWSSHYDNIILSDKFITWPNMTFLFWRMRVRRSRARCPWSSSCKVTWKFPTFYKRDASFLRCGDATSKVNLVPSVSSCLSYKCLLFCCFITRLCSVVTNCVLSSRELKFQLVTRCRFQPARFADKFSLKFCKLAAIALFF